MSVHLENSLYELCSQRILEDAEFRRTAKKRNFEQVDNALFEEYKLYQVKKTVAYAREHSRFYKERFAQSGLTSDDITAITDLQKFPFTEETDLTGTSYHFLCTSQSAVEKPVTFYSSGTTGLQKRIFYSQRDIVRILQFLPRGMNTVADRGEGRIQIFLQNTSGRGTAYLLMQSLIQFGFQAVISDPMSSSEEIIKTCVENSCNVWFGDAASIFRVTKEMQYQMDLPSLKMRTLFLTMDNISDSMKRYLEKAWNCRISTHYGLTEMNWGLAVDCGVCDGYHYDELDVIAEVVDPKTGEVLPAGEVGELVFTSLDREAMPLIRYRSGDMSSLSAPICGHHLKTLHHIVRRRDGDYDLGQGHCIYTAMLEEALFRTEEAADYRAYADGKHLFVDVAAVNQKYTHRSDDTLRQEIRENLTALPPMRAAGAEVEVRILPGYALKKYCYEKKRILPAEQRP